MKRILSAVCIALCAGVLCAEPKVLFEDKLADKPGGGWSWVKENAKAWGVKGGVLEFFLTTDQENVLARAVPDASNNAAFSAEVTVSCPPKAKLFAQVGLFFVADGKVVAFAVPDKKELLTEKAQLRLLVEGKKYSAQYKPGGKGEYQTAFTGDVPRAAKGKLQVALSCKKGTEDAAEWVRFSDFRVTQLPPPEPDLTTKFAQSDPDFKTQGEYEGESKSKAKYGAQVVAKGAGKFEVYILTGGLPGAGWDKKKRDKVAAATKDKAVTFSDPKGWAGTIAGGKLTAKSGDDEIELRRVERKSPTMGAKPPDGAAVLFDGKSADEWNGGRIVAKDLLYRGTSSKKGFTAGKLHLEFRTPYQPKAGGQGRGNSGVYIHGREIQVLDSFGLKGENNECGAFYSSKAPDVNMCLPPLTWQTYDVEVKPDDKGDLKATVSHNGVVIHKDYPIAKKGAKGGGIQLQDHGNPVVYRNIWFVEAK